MSHISEKGGSKFEGVKLLLCENPLPPLDEAVAAAHAELSKSNFYTEVNSWPLRHQLSEQMGVPEKYFHINAGSELILRQLFDKYGDQVHLLTPTYPLFPEIAKNYTETHLMPKDNFEYDLSTLRIPSGTTLTVIVNPNNPNGGTFDMRPLPKLLEKHPYTMFLVDEAFIGVAGQSVAPLVAEYHNLIVTRTFSKAHSLAGFRVGYAIMPSGMADEFNKDNDAYPLTRPSQAAAMATMWHEDQIQVRVANLRHWATDLAGELEVLGIKTYPTETYIFLADFAPYDASEIAAKLTKEHFLLKALEDKRLGPGFMRITTSTPENNGAFLEALKKIMKLEEWVEG